MTTQRNQSRPEEEEPSAAQPVAPLRTRRPTGKVAYPLILVEGPEKAGKSVCALSLSASERVGRTFVLELDEPTADEYAALGPYEVVEHNGTYGDILAQLEAACREPGFEGRPNVIVVDTATALWDLLKDWTDARARNSRSGRKRLAEDPDAEVDVAMNLWNDAKDRWYKVITLLRRWEGIGVLVARGREVAKVVNGQPVAGQVDYSVQAEKSTTFAVSAWVRMRRPHTATLIAVRKLGLEVPASGLALPDERVLEHLIFDLLGADAEFGRSTAVEPTQGIPAARAKRWLLDLLTGGGLSADDARTHAAGLWHLHGLGQEITAAQWDSLAEAAREHLASLVADVGEPWRSMPIDEVLDGLARYGAGTVPMSEARARLARLAQESGAWPSATKPDPVAAADPAAALVEAVIAEVAGMPARDVDAALAERGLQAEGKVDARRRALAQALLRERAPGTRDAPEAPPRATERPAEPGERALQAQAQLEAARAVHGDGG